MSSAFHLQTNGQTEQMNRTIEQTLHLYINYSQTNWDSLLPLVEFAINNHRQSSTDHSPFFLHSGHHPRTPDTASLPPTPIPVAATSTDEIKATLTLTKDLLRDAQDRQATYADTRRQDIKFHPGDRVMLRLVIPMDTNRQRPSHKLLPIFDGPFTVAECLGPVAYHLQLPPTLHIHDVFHVSRLKAYHAPEDNDPSRSIPPRPPPILLDDGTEEYEVERILDRCTYRHQLQYLMKWLGYGDEDNQWIPARDLTNAPDLIRDFEAFCHST